MDKPKIEELAKQLIEAIGEDSTREGLKDTPRRMAKSFEKLFGVW